MNGKGGGMGGGGIGDGVWGAVKEREGSSGDNGVKESVDSGKGGCVGPYFVVDLYSVSSYRPSHSSLPQSVHLVQG